MVPRALAWAIIFLTVDWLMSSTGASLPAEESGSALTSLAAIVTLCHLVSAVGEGAFCRWGDLRIPSFYRFFHNSRSIKPCTLALSASVTAGITVSNAARWAARAATMR